MKNSDLIGVLVGGLALGGLIGYATASQTSVKPKAEEATAPGMCSAGGQTTPNPGEVIEIHGKKYTEADLPQDIRSTLYEIQHESHEKIIGSLKEFAVRFALAQEKSGKVQLDKLPTLQDLIVLPKPDEAAVKAFFEANKAKIPPGTTYEQVKPQIEQYLARDTMSSAFQAKIAALEKAGTMKVLMKEPIPPVINFDLTGLPFQGPADAPITLVEASDYLCPHCQKTQPEVESVVKEFSGKIRFVQANFALNPEGLSGLLAQGAYCAQKQSMDKFWKFHHEAFSSKQGASSEAKTETLAVADKAGVKNEAFEKCLETAEAKAFVAKTAETLTRAGINGTPVFFINGRKLGHGSLKESVVSALSSIK